jgi:hypothetical protein
MYMDDILLLHQDPKYLRLATLQIGVYLQCLGWTLSPEKCSVIPSHEVKFLGWRLCLDTRTLSMTEDMQHSILAFLKNTLRAVQTRARMQAAGRADRVPQFPACTYTKGKFVFARIAIGVVGRGRLAGVGWIFYAPVGDCIGATILVEERINEHAVVLRSARIAGYADDRRCGAWMEIGVGNWRSCLYYVRMVLDGRLEYNVQSARNSGGVAVVNVLQGGAQAKAMTVRSDNAATVCNLQRQGAGLTLLKLTRAIFRILTTLDIRVHFAHRPGKENVLVDALSRM